MTSEERKEKARIRMAAYRQTDAYKEWLQSSRELRRSLKEKYRREAGATPRSELAEQTATRAAAIEARRLAKDDFFVCFIGPPPPHKAMTAAELYQWRIKNDRDFYARELDRAQRYKARTRPGYRGFIVGWSAMPDSVKEVKHLQYLIKRQIERTAQHENHQ